MSFLTVPMDLHGLLLFLSLIHGIVCVGRLNSVFLSPAEKTSFLIVPMGHHGLLLFLSLIHGIVCVGRRNSVFLSPSV